MNRRIQKHVLAITAALALAGCGGVGDKAGGDGASVTLKAAVGDPKDAPGTSTQMAAFAQNVDELSDGKLTIDVAYGQYDQAPANESRIGAGDAWIAGKAQDGSIDLAMIPARSWEREELGVTTMRALSAPFLVDSNALAADIAGGPIAADLMGGLSALDLTGLVLLPDAVRHPVGFDAPLRAPADFAGKTLRASDAPTLQALFDSLGADTTDVGEWEELMMAGGLHGADTSFSFLYLYPSTSTVTGNVALYSKMNTIVMPTAVFDRLSEDHRAILTAAAAATLDDVVAGLADESELAIAACERGGTVVLASPADLAALETAVAPVYDQLEDDPGTKASIAAIRERKAAIRSAVPQVQACSPGAAAGQASPGAGSSEQAVLNGTYRLEWDADDVRAAGYAEPDVADWVGVYELTLTDGQWEWSLRQEEPAHEPWISRGTYIVTGDRVSSEFADTDDPFDGMPMRDIDDTYRWTLVGDQLSLMLESSTGTEFYQAGGGMIGGSWTRVP
jgi:TRAP-type C4-dicarboxylate transport system substrate-binding protein